MDNNLEDKKQRELDQAGQNTVHAAGKAAATYFGGTVGNVAYDKISKTKLGQGIEQGVGKVIGRTPVVNQVNKGLNDVGAVDLVDKAADLGAGKVGALKGGKRFNKPTTLNNNLKRTGNRPNLNSSLNKGVPQDETPKALQNKNHNQSIRNRFSNSSYDETEENDENEDYDDYNENQTEDRESLLENKQKMAIIKKILPIVLPILTVLIVLLLLIMMLGNMLGSVSSFFSLKSHKTDDPEYSYNNNQPELLAAEKMYNDAILGSKDGRVKGVISLYQERYGVTLDWYLINAVIMYRYTIESDFKDDDTNYEELLESEIDAKFEELKKMEEGENNSSTEPGINYVLSTWTVPWIATMMVNKDSNGYYYSDTKKDGEFYNYLIDSLFLKVYYRNFLKDNEYETRKKLVDEIYEYAENAREMIEEENNTAFLSGMAVVHLQTCAQGYKYTTINGLRVYDNPLTNEGTTYPSYLDIKDYIKGVLMTEVGSYFKPEYKEGLKAMATVSLSFMLEDNESGFDLKNGEMYFPTGDCRQVACDPNNGCSYLKGKTEGRFGTAFVGLNRFGSTEGQHHPLTESENQLLDEIVSEIFGDVIVKKGVTSGTFSGSSDVVALHHYATLEIDDCVSGSCMGQIEVMADAKNGMQYRDLLDKYFYNIDFDVINIQEGLYVEDSYYANAQYDGNIIFYDQNDYKTSFCGRDTTISKSGCGVTAAAIVVSTFTGNKQYDPIYMNNLAQNNGRCGDGISGTLADFFIDVASKFNLEYQAISQKNASRVIEVLKTGKSLVIAHMGPGLFTNNGHYIVLTSVNAEGKVYVHDPNNRQNIKNHNSGNGWYDINTIADQLKTNFYVLTKRGG